MKRSTAILCACALLCLALGCMAEGAVFMGSYAPEESPDMGELCVTHPAPEVKKTASDDGRTVITAPMRRSDTAAGAPGTPYAVTFPDVLPIDDASFQPRSLTEQEESAARAWAEGFNTPEGRGLMTGGGVAMTFTELRGKFPSGKYWNHVSNPGDEKAQNNPDGWTEIPCPERHTDFIDTELQTCNAYWPGEKMIGLQCYGYADKLGLDATGIDPETWEKNENAEALDALKPADIIRISNGNGGEHSIFVLDVDGDDVFYTDCNEGGTCVIRWDQQTTKSALAEQLEYVKRCPSDAFTQDEYCHCSANVSGTYVVTEDVTFYARHCLEGDNYGTIPADATVSVIMGDADLAHVTYGGQSGYVDPRCLYRQGGSALECNWEMIRLTMPDVPTKTVLVQCSGELPDRYRITADVSGGIELAWVEWLDDNTASFDVSAVAPKDGRIIFYLLDDADGTKVATCELSVRVLLGRTTLILDDQYIREQDRVNGDISRIERFKVTANGYLPDEYSFRILSCSYDICRFEWPGDWSEDGLSHILEIEAMAQGDSTIVIGLECQSIIRAAASIHLTVTGTIEVIPLPDHVYLNLPDNAERIMTYTFRGLLPRYFDFYVTDISSDAIGTANSGGFYEMEDGTLAIDVKVLGHHAGSGAITTTLWDAQYPNDKKVKLTFEMPVTVWQRQMGAPDFVLPANLTDIESGAFEGIAARIVRLPEGLNRISSRAFADDLNLAEINIPESVTLIEAHAFDGIDSLTVFGKPGTIAEAFALKMDYNFVPVE